MAVVRPVRLRQLALHERSGALIQPRGDPVLAPPRRRLAVLVVTALAPAIDQMIDDLAAGLAGDFGLAVLEELDIMVETDGYGPVHPARAVRQRGLRLVGDLRHRFTPGLARGVFGVVREGVAFPIVGCYNRRRSIPLTRVGVEGGWTTFPG